MSKKKIFTEKIRSLSFFFLASFFFSAGAFFPSRALARFEPSEDYLESNDWSALENHYILIREDEVWSGTKTFSDPFKPVLIVDGAEVKIEKGARVEFVEMEIVYGRIEALGTPAEPIVFTRATPDYSAYSEIESARIGHCSSGTSQGLLRFSDWSFFDGNNPSMFRYVKFENPGRWENVDVSDCFPTAMKENPFGFFSIAYADEPKYELRFNPAIEFSYGKVSVENSDFSGNSYRAIQADPINYPEEESRLEIVDSNFEKNPQRTAVFSSAKKSVGGRNYKEDYDSVVLKNNWYGDSSGPEFSGNPEGKGEKLEGPMTVDGWSQDRHQNFHSGDDKGNSNVLFLPGIKASKLYQKEGFFEDQVWPPNYLGGDIKELMLDENGKSIKKIYTRDLLFEFPVTGGNIYKSFEETLESLKAKKEINDYLLFAYDWRKSVRELASDGTDYPEGVVKSALEEIRRLAENSQSRKVTVVAHSNGGLLAKALARQLEESGEADKIDRLVLVGTPQMGTPRAILSLLYGYEEDLVGGTLMSQKDARILAENMPGAYGLLPSEKYFQRLEESLLDFSSLDPFSEKTRYGRFRQVYGEGIFDFENFQKFLSAEGDGREKPASGEVEKENVLRKNLLREASETHQWLDDWNPPEGLKIIQISGWGLDTISGIKYREKEKSKCYPVFGSKIPSCVGVGKFEPVYDPRMTADGDRVVVSPSALMLGEKDGAESFWVDLWSYDDILNKQRSHSDILEISDMKYFMERVLKQGDLTQDLPKNIKKESPQPINYKNAKPRIRMSLYSPLDIHIYDSEKNHTGPKIFQGEEGEISFFEEGIPGSYYYSFGERKYIGFPSGEKIKVELKGYAEGSFNLRLEEIGADERGKEKVVFETSFSRLPVSPETSVFLEIPEKGLEEISPLKLDYDGDGEVDVSLSLVPGGEAVLPRKVSPLEVIESFRRDAEIFFRKGAIKSRGEKNKLLAFSETVKKELLFLDFIENSPFFHQKAKTVLEKVFREGVRKKIETALWQIEKNKKDYSQEARESLLEDLEWIKNNL